MRPPVTIVPSCHNGALGRLAVVVATLRTAEGALKDTTYGVSVGGTNGVSAGKSPPALILVLAIV